MLVLNFDKIIKNQMYKTKQNVQTERERDTGQWGGGGVDFRYLRRSRPGKDIVGRKIRVPWTYRRIHDGCISHTISNRHRVGLE